MEAKTKRDSDVDDFVRPSGHIDILVGSHYCELLEKSFRVLCEREGCKDA